MAETGEETSEGSPSTDSSWRIVALWRKIHFSGRVIMCSVLLGLGLILIGALIFVTNMDDDKVDKTNSDGSPELPLKAPSNYSGPVVMGIGTFIVTVGVIMCLFETQVCRKKTADSKPLMSESADDAEKQVSDTVSVPSTSHGHKIHRHGARKASSSPRKHKSRHAKSRSKERNQEKKASPKSLPLSIETPRYLTSSGENFLTPPNTFNEHTSSEKEEVSRNASSIKSFNSSDPSWNQSAEFLTPSTSFRDASLSLNNSIEIDPKHAENNTSTELSEKQMISPEYFTPLTVEEDRIRQQLIRVKSEQTQASDASQSVETPENLKLESDSSASSIQKEIGENCKSIEKTNNESSDTHELPSIAQCDLMISKENKLENLKMEDTYKLDQNKCENLIHEVNDGSVISETINNTLNEKNTISEAKILPANTCQRVEDLQNDSQSLLKKPDNQDLQSLLNKDVPNSQDEINESQNDFDSSVSSNETIVPPDCFQENPSKTDSTPEFANSDRTHQNKDNVDKKNTGENTVSSNMVEATEPKADGNESVDTLNIHKDALTKVNENVSKEGSS